MSIFDNKIHQFKNIFNKIFLNNFVNYINLFYWTKYGFDEMDKYHKF